MNDDVTPAAPEAPGPHPLAAKLARTLGPVAAEPRALVLGIGSGRNVPVLLAAGIRVEAVEDDPDRAEAALRRFSGDARVRVVRAPYTQAVPYAPGFDGALATHALLHGTPFAIAAAVNSARDALRSGGALFATIGSKRDPRFGRGERIAADTFAPERGDEAGVAHGFFDERGVRELFAGFTIEVLQETQAGAIVGRWAHGEHEAADIVHWWIEARRA